MNKIRIIILMVVLGGSIFFIILCRPATDENSGAAPKKDVVPASTKNEEQESYKIYENKKYGYSLSYPSNWAINPEDAKEVFIHNPSTLSSSDSLSVVLHEEKNVSYIQEFSKSFPEGCDSLKQVSFSNHNLDAHKMICVNSFSGGADEYYFIERDRDLYELGFSLSENEHTNSMIRKIIMRLNFD